MYPCLGSWLRMFIPKTRNIVQETARIDHFVRTYLDELNLVLFCSPSGFTTLKCLQFKYVFMLHNALSILFIAQTGTKPVY